MRLILYNDDLGATYGLTNAVRDSFLNGTTTCASIRTNGVAFRYALEEVLPTIGGLELGLHVNLTKGPPQAHVSRVPRLIDRKGYLKRSFLDYYRATPRDAELLRQIEIEIRAQFEKATSCGLKLNHVNGHQHVHMIPSVFDMTCRMMTDYGLKFIRIPSEPFFFYPGLGETRHMISNLNFLKSLILKRLTPPALYTLRRYGLSCVGCFVGILYTGRMNVRVVEKAVQKLKARRIDVAEILFHPADIDHERDLEDKGVRVPYYYYSEDRRAEKRTLFSPRLREFLREQRIQLVTHGELESSGSICPSATR